jgi:hypothetical protein
MSTITVTSPDDLPLDYQLPAHAYRHLIRRLRLTLPPPPGDTAEDLLHRDYAAIACIAGLAPVNMAEAELAAQFFAASEQWKDRLRCAQAPDATPAEAARCRANALNLMRQANGVLRLLLRLQDTRRKLEADTTACDRLARIEHVTTAMMAEALDTLRAETAAPDPAAVPEPAPAVVAEPPAPAAGASGEGGGAVPDWVLAPDLVAAAERYAATYPERAASIRRTGKMPHDEVRYFDPPEGALCETLIAAQTPALVALDQAFAQSKAA